MRNRKPLLELFGKRAKKYRKVPLTEKLDAVLGAPVPLSALKSVEHKLTRFGIPFAFIGGHAVTIHGHPRLTSDVDVLVQNGDVDAAVEAFGEGKVTPLTVGGKSVETTGGLTIDFVSPRQPWVDDAVRSAVPTKYGRVVSKPYLILMKMWAARGNQDDTDAMEVLRGMTEEEVRETKQLVQRHLPNDVDDLDSFLQIVALG